MSSTDRPFDGVFNVFEFEYVTQVEMAPPDTNRRPSIAGQAIRLGGRAPAAASCRDEVLAALSALAERSGRQTFTVRQVYGERAARGTSYTEPFVFKTIQRMKEAPVRPPHERLERVGREGFRLVVGTSS